MSSRTPSSITRITPRCSTTKSRVGIAGRRGDEIGSVERAHRRQLEAVGIGAAVVVVVVVGGVGVADDERALHPQRRVATDRAQVPERRLAKRAAIVCCRPGCRRRVFACPTAKSWIGRPAVDDHELDRPDRHPLSREREVVVLHHHVDDDGGRPAAPRKRERRRCAREEAARRPPRARRQRPNP